MSTFLSTFPSLLGGVGLFLMGMILMSDGLKGAASGSLQRILEKATGTPLSAFLSGMGITALVQSSSTTTITTIGFVSAGLLTFPAALGVIVGANVGTTSTGWIVSLLGFKLKIGAIALPFIGVGALMKLLGKGKKAHLGMVLAGFGLIFIGIDFLQESMGGVATSIDLSAFTHTTLRGRLMLLLVGAVLTVLLQSSSAAVAITLTALFGGAIGLEQAAYLVIGQNLGTSVKAVLAAIGATVAAQRTAVAHILFNVITAGLVYLGTPWLLDLADRAGEMLGNDDPAFTIALFHTSFNLLGALLFMPILTPFARMVERLVPEHGPAFTRHLDKSLHQLPDVALLAASRTLAEVVETVLEEAQHLLKTGRPRQHSYETLWAAQGATRETARFLGEIQPIEGNRTSFDRRVSLLHATDHIIRLIEACLESDEPIEGEEARVSAEKMAPRLGEAIEWLRTRQRKGHRVTRHLMKVSQKQAEARRNSRARILELTATGELNPDETRQYLESMRWVDRIGYHAWRLFFHLVEPLTTDDVAPDSPADHSTDLDLPVMEEE